MAKIPYGRQEITEEDIQAVAEALRSDYLTTGPRIAEFEAAMAAFLGAPYAVAVSSGTAALHLSALALDLGPGTRAITSPNTFVASANCVRYAGGGVDFVDIDPATGLMDLNMLEAKLAAAPPGTYQALIPVAFAGHPVDLLRVRQLADQYGCKVLEDACHAPGGWFSAPGGRVHRCGDGSLADLAIFSFHPVKHLTTGEGGLITTADPALYQRLLRLRSHGITRDPALMAEDPGGWYYEMTETGFNYRLTDFQAALGLSQLSRLDAYLEARRRQAARYREGLQGLPLQCLAHAPGHAYHLFVIRVPRRRELYDFLHREGFGVQVHYIPVHLQPVYRALGWKPGDFPQAEAYYAECLSLPLYPGLPEAAQEAVIQAIRNFFQ